MLKQKLLKTSYFLICEIRFNLIVGLLLDYNYFTHLLSITDIPKIKGNF